jgi:hypothetical protein
MTNSPIFPGSAVPPTDPRYATLVRGFNQRWVGQPQYVQVVGDAEQIVRTIQQCVDHKLRPTVRSGGHCYEGWVSLNDGVILDVSSLHKAGWDEENGRYPANPQALLQVDSYGCRINAVDPAATAVPQRSSILKLQYQTYWTEPAQDKVNLDWINDFYAEMYGPRGPRPDGVVDGCYVNYCDSDLVDWQHLYYKDNYPRLQRAKKEWDPHNVFHHGQSIELP